MTKKEWEITANEAQQITFAAPLRKLEEAKKQICQNIKIIAQRGEHHALISFKYYEVSCLEDWCNIYNWLKELGYTVEDNSANKTNPNFYLTW